jgi:UDP-N-acetylmuramyl pentapeptide phosphotransferase/UDP-N-acetylglucosamine-1-phosphate transferase
MMHFLLGLAALSLLASAALAFMLARRSRPVARKSGRRPRPRAPSGGLAIVPVCATGWAAASLCGIAPTDTLAAIAVMLALAFLARRDGARRISALYRYAALGIATVIGLTFLPGGGHVFQGLLPVTLDLILSSLLWIAAMDLPPRLETTDGAMLVQTITIGIGIAIAGMLVGNPENGSVATGIAVAAAALGALAWVLPPTRLPVGAVGTLPIGFALAWMLLGLAGRGHWAPAVILPLRAVVPVGAVLRRQYRRLRGASKTDAPARSRVKPDSRQALTATASIDGLLVPLACLAVFWPWPALLAAIPVAAGLSGLPLERLKVR